VQQVFKQRKRASLAMGLAGLLNATQADEGLATGFGGGEAGPDAVISVESYVCLQFGGEVGFSSPRTKHSKKASPYWFEFPHIFLLFGA
jgi:hypothetical protein